MTENQLRFMDWEFGVFFHFGIRSFFMGHTDWDGKPMPASAFNPKQLDCEQWIRTAKAAGAAYAILVCKHHDGFANWPTAYSEYSVKAAPWKDGKGDVVAEFVAACHKYDMRIGLYYSPAQWGGAIRFENGKAYDDYFISQVSELLTNYGKIDYLWFDGCGSNGHEYDKTRIIAAIRAMQPEILLFEMWDPDTRWIGNEDGYADMPNSNVQSDGTFLPGECDCMIRDTWFDCAPNEDKLKSVDELMGTYEYSVGRGANLLLNIGPDHRGLLPDKDTARLLEFGEAIRKRYGHPLPIKERFDNGIEFAEGVLVNRLLLRADIEKGELSGNYAVYAHICHGQKPICVYRGECVGRKAICAFPTIRAKKFTVVFENAENRLADISACYAE